MLLCLYALPCRVKLPPNFLSPGPSPCLPFLADLFIQMQHAGTSVLGEARTLSQRLDSLHAESVAATAATSEAAVEQPSLQLSEGEATLLRTLNTMHEETRYLHAQLLALLAASGPDRAALAAAALAAAPMHADPAAAAAAAGEAAGKAVAGPDGPEAHMERILRRRPRKDSGVPSPAIELTKYTALLFLQQKP